MTTLKKSNKHIADKSEYTNSHVSLEEGENVKIIERRRGRRSNIVTKPFTPSKYDNTSHLLDIVFGTLPSSDFDDLKYRSKSEIHLKLAKIFSELPSNGFLPEYKNPCWVKNNREEEEEESKAPGNSLALKKQEGKEGGGLACLPYVYILGQPKCGTSDLFERVVKHQSGWLTYFSTFTFKNLKLYIYVNHSKYILQINK